MVKIVWRMEMWQEEATKALSVDGANTQGPACQHTGTQMPTHQDQHVNITTNPNQHANTPGSTFQHRTKMPTDQDQHSNTTRPTCPIFFWHVPSPQKTSIKTWRKTGGKRITLSSQKKYLRVVWEGMLQRLWPTIQKIQVISCFFFLWTSQEGEPLYNRPARFGLPTLLQEDWKLSVQLSFLWWE